MAISRRDMLKLGALGALGTAGVGLPLGGSVATGSASRLSGSDMPRPFASSFTRPPRLLPYDSGLLDGAPVNYYSVTARQGTAQILPRLSTPVWGYNGTFPGPTIHVDRGTHAVLRVRNHLPAQHPIGGHLFDISTHLHGSASLPQYDGYASDLTHNDNYKQYHYPNVQNARTLWYHDHAVHHTAINAYTGLAAQYHLHDETERDLLPQGEFDVPLTITDAMFGKDGWLAYDDNDHSGLYGDVVLVNGRAWPVMKVKRRIYRFRILNASIARSYRLSLSTGDPVTFVATDGGLMPRAKQVGMWRHGQAERYEVLVDFSKYQPGQRVVLRNSSNKNNVDYDHTNKVMAFDVVDEPFDTLNNTIPVDLDPGNEVMNLSPAQSKRTRRFRLERSDVTNMWSINGSTWSDVVASDYQLVHANPDLNDVEVWEFENKSGGWFHPTHIHLVDFKILTRNGKAPFAYEQGPKDVVYVGEGEKVRLLMKFGPHRGKYMIHCHNLPHEDHDMMVQFSVGLKPGEVDLNDPITADPCKDDDLPEDPDWQEPDDYELRG
jgi:FtsP/CotA-like multicopper oxidase with cupredoxin domain